MNRIEKATKREQEEVLNYLLSMKNVINVCGLPLIPVANGRKVSLTPVGKNTHMYTLLTRDEFNIFASCDDYSIPLHLLPQNIHDILLELGPQYLNVRPLEVPRIVEYLSHKPNLVNLYLSEVKMDPNAVRWLSDFWVWFDNYKHKKTLLPELRNLFLLPSTNGLKKVESALFKMRKEHPIYTQSYLSLGVPFFAAELSDAAHRVLESYHFVKRISDIPFLLDALPLTTTTTPPTPLECENILKHLGSNLDNTICQERIQRVKRLPIFPILSYSASNGPSPSVNTNWAAIPDGFSIRSVRRPTFVPSVIGILFVALDNITPAIIKVLEPNHSRALSEDDLVEYAVNDMSTQSEQLQVAVLEYIIRNRTRIPPFIVELLRTKAFVLAEDGRYCTPCDIVDPDSPIASLYPGSDGYPARNTVFQKQIVQLLKAIGFMKVILTPEIVRERIAFISSRISSDSSMDLARNLLTLLGTSSMDFTRIQIDLQVKWLPTNHGLCAAHECRHAALSSPALFDKVLAVLESFSVPHSLQVALGWDKVIPFKVLLEQLDSVLASEKNYDTVVEIIKELGQRQCTDQEIALLEKVTRGRSWVPTTDRTLVDTKTGVFKYSPTMLNSGFSQVKLDLKSEIFLRRMGCSDK